jgi:hypothetical protein
MGMGAAAESRATAVERAFEKPLLVAAVLSIPTTILQSASLGEPWSTLGTTLNWLIWIAFLAQVVAMLVVVPDRGRYLRTHPLELAIVILTRRSFSKRSREFGCSAFFASRACSGWHPGAGAVLSAGCEVRRAARAPYGAGWGRRLRLTGKDLVR